MWGATELQVVHAANVLGRLDPLKHVAPFRKSQMQHALSDMVSSILAHNVMTGNPRYGLITQTHGCVSCVKCSYDFDAGQACYSVVHAAQFGSYKELMECWVVGFRQVTAVLLPS